MTVLYELAVLGNPTEAQVQDLERCLAADIEPFGLRLGREVGWSVAPADFRPHQQHSSAAVFFGTSQNDDARLPYLLRNGIPVIPTVWSSHEVTNNIPASLRRFNCLDYQQSGPQRLATALLECVGLLPRQRRVFVSYRRTEAREAALQLFDALSARLFDVFLDTHGIAPAEDFQAMLWHRLCDSDVLVMLDTPAYFESRWTSAEFGRALAKGISVLRIGWPDSTPSARTLTASRAELLPTEVDPQTGRIADGAIERICTQLEAVRSKSLAVRNLNLISNLRNAVEKIGGEITGVGMSRAVFVRLPDDRNIVVYPAVGVPTSTTLHDAATNVPEGSAAVVFDPVGLHPKWLTHLEWLGQHITTARWVKSTEAAWHFADWGA